MKGKPAENLVQSNEEYAKLRGRLHEAAWPFALGKRMPGARGLGRDELEAWTTEELRRAATTLGTPSADMMRRDELIEALLSAELASVTGREPR